MSSLKAWALDTGLRAVKTGAQTAVALVTANTAGLTAIPWVHVLDVAGLAVVVSVLHNVSTLSLGKPEPTAPESPDLGPVI